MNSERRIYPRLHVNIPAEVDTSTGDGADVTLLNLSESGMLIEGGQQLLTLKSPVEGTPLELYLHFGLQEQAVHCHCRLVYTQRQSQNCIRYGLAILGIDDESRRCIQAHITESL